MCVFNRQWKPQSITDNGWRFQTPMIRALIYAPWTEFWGLIKCGDHNEIGWNYICHNKDVGSTAYFVIRDINCLHPSRAVYWGLDFYTIKTEHDGDAFFLTAATTLPPQLYTSTLLTLWLISNVMKMCCALINLPTLSTSWELLTNQSPYGLWPAFPTMCRSIKYTSSDAPHDGNGRSRWSD